MSTDLYGIRVLEKDGDTLLLQVFITYSDIETLPGSASFFLMALRGPARDADPLAVELKALRAAGLDPDLMDAERFIAEASLLEEVYPGVTDFSEADAPSPPPPRPVLDHRGRKPRHRDRDAAPLWLHHHGQERNGGLGGWAHEDRLPRGLYFVRVTDPRWIAHLVPGQSWGTTAYEM